MVYLMELNGTESTSYRPVIDEAGLRFLIGPRSLISDWLMGDLRKLNFNSTVIRLIIFTFQNLIQMVFVGWIKTNATCIGEKMTKKVTKMQYHVNSFAILMGRGFILFLTRMGVQKILKNSILGMSSGVIHENKIHVKILSGFCFQKSHSVVFPTECDHTGGTGG